MGSTAQAPAEHTVHPRSSRVGGGGGLAGFAVSAVGPAGLGGLDPGVTWAARAAMWGAAAMTASPILGKAVVSLDTGLEDAEMVTVALLVAVGAADQGRPARMFLTKEAVRLVQPSFAVGCACGGCPPLADLVARYEAVGGRCGACPICLASRHVDTSNILVNAEPGGTLQLWEWIGAEGATTFSY